MPETASETHDRLCKVIAASAFAALSEPHAWQKVEHLSTLPSASLAVVRDGSAWYALAPVARGTVGAYRILVFHFAGGSNASGFVAWLAALFKKEAATGAMVVCGYDARATEALWQTSLGLFDYWGCPWDRGDDVIALVEHLRRKRQCREPSSP
jgi:ActR/RegA family two-component response regulator